jgi:hypothetical protein
LHDEFTDTLRGIADRLQSDLLSWGEQAYHTEGCGIPVFSAAYSLLHVSYAVHVAHRVVIIRGFDLMPSSPLGESP